MPLALKALFTHTHAYIYIYSFSYMLPSDLVAFALVPSEHDDNCEWFMGAVAGNRIPLRDL